MKTEIIEFNETEIYCPIENGQIYIAIKPICQALGIKHHSQIDRLKRHRKFASTILTMSAVGADSKAREMVCIPLKFVFGWLASIDTSKVKEEIRDQIEDYQMECYEVLYDHFYQKADRYKRRDSMILQMQDEVERARNKRTTLGKEIKEKEARIKELLKTDPSQTDLFLEEES